MCVRSISYLYFAKFSIPYTTFRLSQNIGTLHCRYYNKHPKVCDAWLAPRGENKYNCSSGGSCMSIS